VIARFVHICSIVVTGVPIAARLENSMLAFVFGVIGGGIAAVFYLKYDGYSHWWDRGITERLAGLLRSVWLLVLFGAIIMISASQSERPLHIGIFFATLFGHLLILISVCYALAKREDRI
jgi:hypothetical protein